MSRLTAVCQLHISTHRGGPKTGVSGGDLEKLDCSCLLSLRFGSDTGYEPLRDPDDKAQAGGQTPLEISAAADAPPRDLFSNL